MRSLLFLSGLFVFLLVPALASAQTPPPSYNRSKAFSFEELGIPEPAVEENDRLYAALDSLSRKTLNIFSFCKNTITAPKTKTNEPPDLARGLQKCLCANIKALFQIRQERTRVLADFLKSRPDLWGKNLLIKRRGEPSGLFIAAKEQQDIPLAAFQEEFACRP